MVGSSEEEILPTRQNYSKSLGVVRKASARRSCTAHLPTLDRFQMDSRTSFVILDDPAAL
jgi:hypothetical protein